MFNLIYINHVMNYTVKYLFINECLAERKSPRFHHRGYIPANATVFPRFSLVIPATFFRNYFPIFIGSSQQPRCKRQGCGLRSVLARAEQAFMLLVFPKDVKESVSVFVSCRQTNARPVKKYQGGF